MKTKTALYTGSFDPVHYGHLDIIERAAKVFDEVVVGIAVNPKKTGIFTLEERADMIKRSVADNVQVVPFPGLTVDFAYEQGISTVVKGIRGAADAEYENALHQAGVSQGLGIDTFVLFSKPELSNVSSSMIKAIQTEQGSIHTLVPLHVKQALEQRISGQYIVGVTGEPGSGKSYVCERLEELGKARGIPTYNIELDHLGHQIISSRQEPVYQEIRKQILATFKGVGNSDGTINRKALGEIVFNDQSELDKLNAIMAQPLVVRFRKEMYGKKGLILFNAALITESDMSYICNNNVVLVDVDKKIQEKRLKVGRELTAEQIARRLGSQYDIAEKRDKLTNAISRDRNGKIWTVDTSKNCEDGAVEALFDDIVKDLKIKKD